MNIIFSFAFCILGFAFFIAFICPHLLACPQPFDRFGDPAAVPVVFS
jgi:hypothetical protein